MSPSYELSVNELLELGPEQLLSELRSAPEPNRFPLPPLAMACTRMVFRGDHNQKTTLLWAEAAIECNLIKAAVHNGIVRQSREETAFGLQVAMILKFGVAEGHLVLDPRRIVEWLDEAIDWFGSTEAYEGAPKSWDTIILRHRFRRLDFFYASGSLPERMQPWFEAVERRAYN